jgi:hypothetical protein
MASYSILSIFFENYGYQSSLPGSIPVSDNPPNLVSAQIKTNNLVDNGS